MFAQVLQGRVEDVASARRHLQRWCDEIAPGASGLLGATTGVTDDGALVHVARFRSAGDAGLSFVRDEHQAWWREMDQLLDGPLVHHDCDDVVLVAGGGADDAGFVQVIQGHNPGGQSLARIVGVLEPLLAEHRPDIIGGVLARAQDGTVTQVMYFTSEEEAREREAAGLPDEDAEVIAQLWGDPPAEARFYDLRAPLLITP